MKNKRLGFTLIEIMIVVSIVIALLIIAIPNYLRSRSLAIESTAVSNSLAIHSACQLYHINNGAYPPGLADLTSPAANPPYIDPSLASGTKQGYQLNYNYVDDNHFTLNADPSASGLFTTKYFYIDESGAVHAKEGGSAGPDDPIFSR